MADEDDWFERALRESTDGDADEDAPGGFADFDDGDGGDEDDGGLFEEDFGAALADAPAVPGEESGPGGPPGGESQSFDDEDFESDLPRVELGIEGLDSMIQGGVPERSLLVAIGSAGTGKTTFGLQFLHQGLEEGERTVFITLEESRERIVATASEKGWDFAGYIEAGQLAVVDIDPVEMANSLTAIRNELPLLIEEFGASRLVLDSVSLLEMMYQDESTRRTEIYDFIRSLKQVGVTTFFTSEASEESPFASKHGIIEYLTDGVFVLRYVRPEDFRETRLAIEIQKLRDANHSRETKPYEITDEGINVYDQANIF